MPLSRGDARSEGIHPITSCRENLGKTFLLLSLNVADLVRGMNDGTLHLPIARGVSPLTNTQTLCR